MSFTVLIAASERLAALQQQEDLTNAEAFADTDALKALDTIARRRPQVVALDQRFAASARGAAFINRIKADPALASCEIRVLDPDRGAGRDVALPADGAAVAPAAVAVDAPPAARLDRTGTRRAERVAITKSVAVLIDGNPATLVNISVVGAQVLSPSLLRPNQHVRMSLVDEARPIRFNGVVAWAAFEMPKEGPRYRAGVNFFDAAPDMVARFIESIT
ncbi:MAG TPA: PilZ domain-containing protein [Vicinamibacterales bacterium]|nr:PilZ domain-containing protein [Vicinamibacterales bacterium]